MEHPLMHLALVGTPNSGKTSLFNALTGSRQKVANYPGVTVERKEGSFVTPHGCQVSLVDLPGTYSLRGRSPDEEITRDIVLGRTRGEAVPDLVLCVADSTNLRLTIRLLPRPDTWTARIDAVVLHPIGGLAILLLILFVMFQAVFAWTQPLMELLSSAFDGLGQLVHDFLPAGLLQSFLQNGVISGVGSVIVFLPQIVIIFLFILLLEDFGYMARAAFLMDRIMGGAGLHGRAFIPLLSSFACAIPGIMATRVIDNRRDRLTTIVIAPLMSRSARIPVYTLIISAFIPDEQVWGWFNVRGLVMFGLYTAGIASALLMSFLIQFFM